MPGRNRKFENENLGVSAVQHVSRAGYADNRNACIEHDQHFFKVKNLLDGLPEIGSLTREQEVESAPETLALHNMREAFLYAHKCCRGALDEDEIYSACYDALCKAAKNFKPGRIRFFGYAKPYIRGALSQVWKTKDTMPNNKNVRARQVEPLCLAQEGESEDVIEEADGITGVFRKEKYKQIFPTTEPELDAIQARDEWRLVEPLISSVLTDKEQTIIALRYKSALSFERIGALLKISRQDVQLTHSVALKKLSRAAKKKLHC
jgi:RNA polymerase sigma factor (sigma-70 family)